MRSGFVSGSSSPVHQLDPPAAAGRPVAPKWRGLTPVRDLTGLTGEQRAATHRTNVRIRELDARDYATYLDDYLAGARRCRTASELRAYGRPADAEAGLEDGATFAEKQDLDVFGVFGRSVGALYRTNRELGDMILRHERRPVPLDVFFDASLTAKVEVGGRTYGGTASVRGGVAPQIGAGGVTVEPGRVEVGADAGLVGAKAAFAGGRLDAVEVTVRAAPGVRASTKQSRAAVEAGIAVGGKAGGRGGAPALHVEAKASAGVTLVTADAVRWALSPKSFWDER